MEESVIGSVECSESDRERDCLSVLIVNDFREEERSSIAVESFVTIRRISGDDDR